MKQYIPYTKILQNNSNKLDQNSQELLNILDASKEIAFSQQKSKQELNNINHLQESQSQQLSNLLKEKFSYLKNLAFLRDSEKQYYKQYLTHNVEKILFNNNKEILGEKRISCLELMGFYVGYQVYQKGEFLNHYKENCSKVRMVLEGNVSRWEKKNEKELNKEKKFNLDLQNLQEQLQNKENSEVDIKNYTEQIEQVQIKLKQLLESQEKQEEIDWFRPENIFLTHNSYQRLIQLYQSENQNNNINIKDVRKRGQTSANNQNQPKKSVFVKFQEYFLDQNTIKFRKSTGNLSTGSILGEQYCHNSGKMEQVHIATEDNTVVLEIDSKIFSDIFDIQNQKINFVYDILKSSFPHAKEDSLNYLINCCVEELFLQPDQILFNQNDKSTRIFMVKKGGVKVQQQISYQSQKTNMKQMKSISKNKLIEITRICDNSLFGIEDVSLTQKKTRQYRATGCSAPFSWIYFIKISALNTIILENQDVLLEDDVKNLVKKKSIWLKERTEKMVKFANEQQEEEIQRKNSFLQRQNSQFMKSSDSSQGTSQEKSQGKNLLKSFVSKVIQEQLLNSSQQSNQGQQGLMESSSQPSLLNLNMNMNMSSSKGKGSMSDSKTSLGNLLAPGNLLQKKFPASMQDIPENIDEDLGGDTTKHKNMNYFQSLQNSQQKPKKQKKAKTQHFIEENPIHIENQSKKPALQRFLTNNNSEETQNSQRSLVSHRKQKSSCGGKKNGLLQKLIEQLPLKRINKYSEMVQSKQNIYEKKENEGLNRAGSKNEEFQQEFRRNLPVISIHQMAEKNQEALEKKKFEEMMEEYREEQSRKNMSVQEQLSQYVVDERVKDRLNGKLIYPLNQQNYENAHKKNQLKQHTTKKKSNSMQKIGSQAVFHLQKYQQSKKKTSELSKISQYLQQELQDYKKKTDNNNINYNYNGQNNQNKKKCNIIFANFGCDSPSKVSTSSSQKCCELPKIYQNQLQNNKYVLHQSVLNNSHMHGSMSPVLRKNKKLISSSVHGKNAQDNLFRSEKNLNFLNDIHENDSIMLVNSVQGSPLKQKMINHNPNNPNNNKNFIKPYYNFNNVGQMNSSNSNNQSSNNDTQLGNLGRSYVQVKSQQHVMQIPSSKKNSMFYSQKNLGNISKNSHNLDTSIQVQKEKNKIQELDSVKKFKSKKRQNLRFMRGGMGGGQSQYKLQANQEEFAEEGSSSSICNTLSSHRLVGKQQIQYQQQQQKQVQQEYLMNKNKSVSHIVPIYKDEMY